MSSYSSSYNSSLLLQKFQNFSILLIISASKTFFNPAYLISTAVRSKILTRRSLEDGPISVRARKSFYLNELFFSFNFVLAVLRVSHRVSNIM